MADHDDGAALLGHLAHRLHDRHALAVVEAARGLVEKDHLRLHHDHGGQGDHLPLSAGEREGCGVEGQAEALGDGACALSGLARSDPRELEPKGNLVEDGVLAELAVGVLKERGDVCGQAARRGLARVEAGHEHLAGGGLEQAVQELGEGRLAGAVLADDAHDLAGARVEGEVLHGGAAPGVGKADVAEADHGVGGSGGAGLCGGA